MKFFTTVDALAAVGVGLLGTAAYRYDPRLLLLFAGSVFLLLARFLARVEAHKPAAAEKNSEV